MGRRAFPLTAAAIAEAIRYRQTAHRRYITRRDRAAAAKGHPLPSPSLRDVARHLAERHLAPRVDPATLRRALLRHAGRP